MSNNTTTPDFREVVISSDDRLYGSPNDYTVSIPSGAALGSKYTHCALKLAEMVESRYQVSAASQTNTLYVDFMAINNSGVMTDHIVTVVLADGTYTSADLAVAVQNQLTIAVAQQYPAYPTFTSTVSFLDTTQKFTIALAPLAFGTGTFTNSYYFWFYVINSTYLPAQFPSSNFNNSLNFLMGFKSNVFYPPNTTGGMTSWTGIANNQVGSDASTIGYLGPLYVCTNLTITKTTVCKQVSAPMDILSIIPQGAPWQEAIYEPTNLTFHPLSTSSNISSISIRFLDKSWNPVVLNMNHRLILRFI